MAELSHSGQNLIAVDGHQARNDGDGLESTRFMVAKRVLELLVSVDVVG